MADDFILLIVSQERTHNNVLDFSNYVQFLSVQEYHVNYRIFRVWNISNAMASSQWRLITPQTENPTRGEEKKRHGSISRKQDSTGRPTNKKNGGRVTTLPSYTCRHDGTREKKMAGTVGCQRRRQNTNTKVSDGSTK